MIALDWSVVTHPATPGNDLGTRLLLRGRFRPLLGA